MKFLVLASIFIGCVSINRPILELRVKNLPIKNGENIDIEIKNNSSDNYCVIIDTLLLGRSFEIFNRQQFYNPDVVLYDRNEEVAEWIRAENSEEDFGNSNKIALFNFNPFILIKSHHAVKLKVPFNLVKDLRNGDSSYYKIEPRKKYKAIIKYRITQEYVKANFKKEKLDSIENSGSKIFIGDLESKKLQVILNNFD